MNTMDVNGKATITEAVHGMNGESLVLMDGRTPLAVLLPVEGADLETIALSLNEQFLRIIERSRISHAVEGGISSEEMRKRFGMPPAEEEQPRPVRRKRKAN